LLLASPLWALAADRSRRPVAVLRVATALSALAAIAMALASTPLQLFAAAACLAACRSPAASLFESLALHRFAGAPERYGRLRLFGSLGFVAGVLATGTLIDRFADAPMLGSAALLAAAALIALWLPADPGDDHPSATRPGPRELASLFAHPPLRTLYATAVLQGLTQSVYDHLFARHMASIGLSGGWTGVAVAVGVIAEVSLLAVSPALLSRVSPGTLIALGTAASLPRWAGTAFLVAPLPLAALQSLHGLTFAAWWTGSLAFASRHAPASMQSTSVAVLMSLAYGLGTLLAMSLAATLGAHAGSPALFLGCAALSLPAAFLALRLRRAA
jgi:PPP family 3-phenylpropionic acid transporter